MESSKELEVLANLQQFTHLTEELQAKFTELLVAGEAEENLAYYEAHNNLILLRSLVNDIHKLFRIQEGEERQTFLKEHGYIKDYAQEVCSSELNYQWFCKTLAMMKEVLRELNAMDLKRRPYTLVLVPHKPIQLEKFKAMIMMYQYAITFSKDDIFSFAPTDERWDELRKFSNRVVLAAPEKVVKDIKQLSKGIQTAVALSEMNATASSELQRTINLAIGGLANLLSKEKRQHNNILFKSNMEISKVKSMWNLSQSGVSKYFLKVLFPYISYMKKIYLSGRAYPMLTEEAVESWVTGVNTSLVLEPAPADQQVTKQNIFLEFENRICVRVISDTNLERKEKFQQSRPDDYSTIIYHIHGGGFISLSSRTHQTYTRTWAKKCGAPVFSVDYRKAPEAPYPRGLADCWQVYNWLLNESHKFFNIKQDKRIILAGDSAGGNLCFGLTNLCVEQGVTLPYAVVGFYPAVNLSLKSFTPSLLYSFSDPLLSFEFLLICLKSYITNDKFSPEKDYFISPLFTPEKVLTRYPQVRIFVGEKDPLHDDAVRFALKLQQLMVQFSQNRVPIQLTTYQNMIHAFLSLDIPGGLKYAQRCAADAIKCLSELVHSS